MTQVGWAATALIWAATYAPRGAEVAASASGTRAVRLSGLCKAVSLSKAESREPDDSRALAAAVSTSDWPRRFISV
jgi:hypothetical protein